MVKKNPLRWYSSPRQIMRSLLTLDDTPHSIALGTAIGMMVGMTPTVGIQMVIILGLAFIMQKFCPFNKLAALITVFISNPLTMVPIYYFNYRVGCLFLSGDATKESFQETFSGKNGGDWWNPMTWWNPISTLFIEFGWPLFLGAILVAVITGVVTYPLTLWLVKNFQKKKAPALQAKAESKETEQDRVKEPIA